MHLSNLQVRFKSSKKLIGNNKQEIEIDTKIKTRGDFLWKGRHRFYDLNVLVDVNLQPDHIGLLSRDRISDHVMRYIEGLYMRSCIYY